MCLLVASKNGIKMTYEEIESAHYNNSDGIGFATFANGELLIEKWITTERAFDLINQYSNNPSILHFRLASHGKVNLENTHPFAKNDWCLAHNGIIPNMQLKNGKSDTRQYIDDCLHNCFFSDLKHPSNIDIIKNHIGNSKFAILSNLGELLIINEDFGHYRKDTWFSNSSYSYGCMSRFNSFKDFESDFDFECKSFNNHDVIESVLLTLTEEIDELTLDREDFKTYRKAVKLLEGILEKASCSK